MAEIIKATSPKLVKKDSYLAMLNAVAILDAAREQGRAILREAETQREEIFAAAREEGLADGLRAYLAETRQLEAALAAFYKNSEPALVRLSLGIARKLLGVELATRPAAIADLVRDSLAGVRHARRITIAVHPSQVEPLKAHSVSLELSASCEVQIVGREDIDPLGCLIDSDCGIIDARLETRLATLERALLPHPEDAMIPNFDHLLAQLAEAPSVETKGRIKEVVGLVARARIPEAFVGELCEIRNPRSKTSVLAEVTGFADGDALLMPLGSLENIGPASEVIPLGRGLTVRVGPELLGRVLNGLGEPIDTRDKGPLLCTEEYPVMAPAPDPLRRIRVTKPLSLGVRVIDSMLTCGEGQRVGLFAAAGVGKSTLIGMIARNTEADVNVIGLIGERGREVRDFIEHDLGPAGMARSVIVCATSDQPSLVRLKGAYVATAIAEYFRDQGLKVLLMMDSVTRFARAQREVGLACGEPPARAGYTPSVFAELPKLLERSGNSDKGSITAFYTVLVAGDDMNEPVADEVRSILDGHIILSRDLAARGHYPAINVLDSVSRVMRAVMDKTHCDAANKLRETLAAYEKSRDLILLGAYESGSDPVTDRAIAYMADIEAFLKQPTDEKSDFAETADALREMF